MKAQDERREAVTSLDPLTSLPVDRQDPTTYLSAEEVQLRVDEELLTFCASHCETPGASFHRQTIRRLFQMAGMPLQTDRQMPEWVTASAAVMTALIKAARSGHRLTVAAHKAKLRTNEETIEP
jgi:hypothetical protein